MGAYIFADYPFDIRFTKGDEYYKDFYSAEAHTDGDTITVCDYDDISISSYGVEYVTEKYNKILRSKSNPSSMLFANEDWTNVKICRGLNGRYSEELMTTAVSLKLCEKKTLLMHASFVDYNGNGVVFTGPSGIGKTTQAQLWEKYLGATIVNGDKVFVRDFNEMAYAYGTPWRGSSPYCLNKKSALNGIVVLLQGENNKIRKLDFSEAIEWALPHVFMHHWDEKCVENVLATFENVLKQVPVWLLECKPDEEAVNITKEAVLSEIKAAR